MTPYQLSPHFTLEELTASEMALRWGIPNVPPEDVVDNLFLLASGLERVRAVLGFPLHVNSGYRGAALNAALGGAGHSVHMNGLAADIVCPSFGTPLEMAKRLIQRSVEVGFDKVIQEGRWLHVAFPAPEAKPKFEALTAHFENGIAHYTAGIGG